MLSSEADLWANMFQIIMIALLTHHIFMGPKQLLGICVNRSDSQERVFDLSIFSIYSKFPINPIRLITELIFREMLYKFD